MDVLHLKDQAETFINLIGIFVDGIVGEVAWCIGHDRADRAAALPSPNKTNCVVLPVLMIAGLAKPACRTPEPLTYTTLVSGGQLVSVVGGAVRSGMG